MHPAERFFVYGFFGLALALFLWRFHVGAADVFLSPSTPGGVAPSEVPAGPDTSVEPPNNYVGLSPGFGDAGPPGPAVYTAAVVIARGAMPAPPRAIT